MSDFSKCRMYEQKYPEVDDVVMVQVKSIAEMGAYVSLLEYNDIEGMILLSELSRRRIRSITKLIKVGAAGMRATAADVPCVCMHICRARRRAMQQYALTLNWRQYVLCRKCVSQRHEAGRSCVGLDA